MLTKKRFREFGIYYRPQFESVLEEEPSETIIEEEEEEHVRVTFE